MTLVFKVEDDQYTISRIDTPNAEFGALGSEIGKAEIGEDTMLESGVRTWIGASKDPFIGNAAGIQQFKNSLASGAYDPAAFSNAEDFFGTLNTSSIVIELPNSMLPDQIHVFASSAMKKDGEWVQVNRLAHVLMTHLFMYNNLPEINEHVHHRPDTDGERAYVVSGTVLRAATLAGKQQNPVTYADEVAARLLPDMISYRVGSKASYSVDEFNGVEGF